MTNKSIMIVISAPSGAGKTSIIKKLISQNDNLFLSISTTTRTPRQCEKDGIDYFFKNYEQFQRMSKNGEFLETVELYGALYGTSREVVNKMLLQQKDVIFDVDYRGLCQILKSGEGNVCSIFIMPPSFDVLKKRLETRGVDSSELIEKRLQSAKSEIDNAKNYDHIVINDNLDIAVQEIKNIILRDNRKYKAL